MSSAGYTKCKIKIGGKTIREDCDRIEAVIALLGESRNLAVDAMNAYDATTALAAADALQTYDLWWFEDVCDPLDFALQSEVARVYRGPIAAGEALFSEAEAKLLDAYAGLRRDRDILLFDPVHCYGIPGYLRIVEAMQSRGWPRSSFWPHGGHVFCLQLASALALGGAEVNPVAFAPFGGLPDDTPVIDGRASPPQRPGIGFENKADLKSLLERL